MYVDEVTGETMPIWFPPTPPHDEEDRYFDECQFLLYVPIPMTEEQLPPVSVRQERKRAKHESPQSQQSPKKKCRWEVNVPKSLFHRPPLMLKKKDAKSSKFRPMLKTKHVVTSTPTKASVTGASVPSTSPKETSSEVPAPDGRTPVEIASAPDWIINEDWALLQAVQQVLDMPLSLVTMMPAHTPNWNLVSDVVNVIASCYRSPTQCKQRFESVIVQREDGKQSVIAEPLTPKKKIKGLKIPPKTRVTKTQKTNVLYASDSNNQFTSVYSGRFDSCKTICNKRNPPSKSSSSGGQIQRNPKHTNMLHDYGITYDKPMHPLQVAAARAKRLANQKKTTEQTTQAATIQHTQGNLTPAMPSAAVAVPQQVANTLVVPNSGQLLGKTLQGGGSNIVVNSFARRVGQQQAANTLTIPASAAKQLQGKLQIQQSSSSLPSMSLTFASGAHSSLVTNTTAVASANVMATRPTITYPQRSGNLVQKLTSVQQIRQVTKQQTVPTTPVKQQVKQLRVTQQQQASPDDIANAIVSGAASNTIFTGKKVQVTKVPPRAVTQQELEMLMKQRTQRTQQVHIAPIQAQVQAQRVRTLAAQQANEQISTSKPLPITVPVTNLVSAVSLTGLNVASSAQAKPLIVTPGQTTLTQSQQLYIQQQLFKKQQQQLQQSRQVLASKQKAVYATVASHQLATSGTSTTVKMTPSIPTQMLNQLVVAQQQQKQRRTMATSKVQQPVTLTVTKLLQAQSTPISNTAIRHTLVPQSSQQLNQQVGQMQLSGAGTMVTAGNVARQQQRMMTAQRQQIQAPRGLQLSVSGSQTAPQQMIVASAPGAMQRPVIAISNPPSSVQVHSQIMTQQIPVRNTAPTALTSPNMTLQATASQTTLQPSASVSLHKSSSPVMSHVITISGADGNLPVSTDNNQFNLQQPK